MNFINSILLFFAVLLIGPTVVSSNSVKEANSIQLAASNEDPYANMVLIHGGTFAMGMNQESVMSEWNNSLRRVTVSSFRMDKYEVSNKKYRDYIHWLEKIFIPLNKAAVVKEALPDTLVWKSDLAYNEPMIEGYFRSKAFNDYPVVGVTWEQANNYCRWRTDRANEKTLLRYGLIDPKTPYVGKMGGITKNDSIAQAPVTTKARAKASDDFIMIPDFRLPTEAEWEYAAKVSSSKNYISNFKNPKAGSNSAHPNASVVASDSPYPWSSNGNESLRNTSKKQEGMFMANFKNGSGDYMGMTGYSNDGAGLPSKVCLLYTSDAADD